MTAFYCGLDFGTSNSTVGVPAGNDHRLCPVEGDNVTLPSAIFFDYEEHRPRFGRNAVNAYIDGVEGRLMRALKSVLGSSLISETTLIERRRIPVSEVIGLMIGHLKSRAEAALGGEVDSVVLGRPVRFVDNDDAADQQAERELVAIARAQGFRHIELQYEPVAAALEYEMSLEREELAMIVDLGGGTSDFAVVRLSPERLRRADRSEDILGRAGVHIGGTDFDRYLSLARVMPELGSTVRIGEKKLGVPVWIFRDLATWHRILSLYTNSNLSWLRGLRKQADRPELIDRLIAVLEHRDGHRLAARVEAAKIALSDVAQTTIALPVRPAAEVGVSRADLESAIDNGLEEILHGIDRCLREAGVTAGQITTVFLTGGSTAVPHVRSRILSHLGCARPVDGDLFGSVGRGLAIDAGRRFGAGGAC